MGFRLTCRGGEALSGVAASIVARLARDAGLGDDDAEHLADSACNALRVARTASSCSEITARARHGRLRVAVRPGDAAGEVAIDGDLVRRRTR